MRSFKLLRFLRRLALTVFWRLKRTSDEGLARLHRQNQILVAILTISRLDSPDPTLFQIHLMTVRHGQRRPIKNDRDVCESLVRTGHLMAGGQTEIDPKRTYPLTEIGRAYLFDVLGL